MNKEAKGAFCELNGKKYYKIENYDCMDNFFMTITSSSDIWNFCWSKGGITAGRIDSNHSIFPYYTVDKVSDGADFTGNYTSVAVKTPNPSNNGNKALIQYWEPFTALRGAPSYQAECSKYLIRNIYKSYNGTEVLFEEINTRLNLKFITGWTSCEKYGLVRISRIENLSDNDVECSVLDGCQNIMPACCDSELQNSNSCLVDAYKKTDLEEKSGLVVFGLSSVVSDKAEPNEGLYVNTCWFSTEDKVLLATDAPLQFVSFEEKLPKAEDIVTTNCLKGKRSSCFICKNIKLKAQAAEEWYQVFDTSLSSTRVAELIKAISDRKTAVRDLKASIDLCDKQMSDFIQSADGIQSTADEITCLHHRQNVMFNIMRGGIILNDGKIELKDFIVFTKQRNKELGEQLEKLLADKASAKAYVSYNELKAFVEKTNNPQYLRLFLEYIPLTFSRRHGDPSRPWNIFSIRIKTDQGDPILNYEGNWRDIFQNWEALVWSYPAYIKNMCAKFLNAMTVEGFNPYKINRAGIDWEIPDPSNPWAQFGYWGDHQVIYFEKLLEFYEKIDYENLLASINEKIYTSSNVPYRLLDYKKILEKPRNSLVFDYELSDRLSAATKKLGSDQKLVLDSNGQPYLLSFAAKVMQIVLAKASNLVPGGGIWLNTQRPEWNDANNALAGYGLSVVTLCYLNRFINTLLDIFEKTPVKAVTIPKAEIEFLRAVKAVYSEYDNDKAISAVGTDPVQRKAFVDKLGLAFEKEREEFYKNGYKACDDLSVSEIIACLLAIKKLVEASIALNKRDDGLYHSYNTLKIDGDKMYVEFLNEMLEGQVAVLSSGLLSTQEATDIINKLYKSKMYEPHQNSFILYPNKELPMFWEKNSISSSGSIAGLENLISRTGSLYLQKDSNGTWHFNPDFRNSELVKSFIQNQTPENQPNAAEQKLLLELYEKTFHHQSFTGRSGTFFAYEGLGSIYWHMISKLLLAVQENALKAYKENNPQQFTELKALYYKVRSGLGFNKSPELYGAFPADPYSHTPYLKGAQQPGMTGQVKEEILTRWSELGLFIENGTVTFNPVLLQKEEIDKAGCLHFTWCKIPVTYEFSAKEQAQIIITINEDNENKTAKPVVIQGHTIANELASEIFERSGKIKEIKVIF